MRLPARCTSALAHGPTRFNSAEQGDNTAAEAALLDNIKKWAKLEVYLQTPAATLDMMMLKLPLQHLASSIEMLGRTYILLGSLQGAVAYLSRGCPLMELGFGLENDNVAYCYSTLASVYVQMPFT
jgi:hypothetical protein